MLTLGRRIGEKIIINDETVVTVLGIKNNVVTFKIKTDRDVVIFPENFFDDSDDDMLLKKSVSHAKG